MSKEPTLWIKRLGQSELRTTTLKFHGMFQMWAYTVGHSRLLFRRTKESGFSTQIDVLFKPVHAMHLPAAFEDIEIVEARLRDLITQPQTGIHPLQDSTIYRVRGKNVDGHVVAGVVIAEETDRAYFDPNPLMGPP